MSKSWIARIRKGDVLKAPNGVLRVVRDVSHHVVFKGHAKEHVRTNVMFAIRHCSWTGRPYTVYCSSDLITMGYRPTKARVRLRSKLDKAIEYNYGGRKEVCMGKVMRCPILPDYSKKKVFAVDCCDVVGVVS